MERNEQLSLLTDSFGPCCEDYASGGLESPAALDAGSAMRQDKIQSLSVAVESLRALRPEMLPLLDGHYAELSEHAKRGYVLQPDWELYDKYEDIGATLCVTLRLSGTLIGYTVGFVSSCFHYRVRTYTGDVIYVVPTCRGIAGGSMLVRETVAEAWRRDCKLVKFGLKESHLAFLQRLLLTEGFAPYERTMVLWHGESCHAG